MSELIKWLTKGIRGAKDTPEGGTVGGYTFRSPGTPLWQVEGHIGLHLEVLEAGKRLPAEKQLSQEDISSLIEHLKEERELAIEGLAFFSEKGQLNPTYGAFLEKRDLIIQRLQSRKGKGG